jgi:ubiquinone/menaquinone biosynthesis C-methylase UbiE
MTDIGTKNEYNRVKWLKKTLRKIPKGKRILDAGAGEQQFKKFCKHLKYTSQDFGKYDGKGNKVALQTKKWDYGKLDIVSDIAKIPVKENSFDAVLCTEVFEHIINPKDALKEFARITKKGGYLILTAPFCSLTHFAPYHYYSGFNRYFYNQMLKETDYEILEIKPNGNYYQFLAQEVRRLSEVSQKYSKWKHKRIINILNMLYLSLLAKIDNKNNESHELLCFGYQVFAKKT